MSNQTLQRGRRVTELIGIEVPAEDRLPLWSRGIVNEMLMSLGKKAEEANRYATYSVGSLAISIRLGNGLRNLGRFSIKDIMETTPEELLKIKNCGKVTALELLELQREIGQ